MITCQKTRPTCSSTSDRKSAEAERGVQKLELTGKKTVQLRAGSEANLSSAGKHNKRTSFRQSLAVCTERAQVGGTLWVTCPWRRAAPWTDWDVSAGPGRFPEPCAATDSLSQNLPATCTLGPLPRTWEGFPEEEGQSRVPIVYSHMLVLRFLWSCCPVRESGSAGLRSAL